MSKKIALVTLALVGSAIAAFVSLSGAGTLLIGGPGSAGGDPTVMWFAPLFLFPLGLAGIGAILVSSLVAKKRRALLGWFCLTMALLLIGTFAVFEFSGMAKGLVEMSDTPWGGVAIVLAVAYALVLLATAGLGVVIARDILKSAGADAQGAAGAPVVPNPRDVPGGPGTPEAAERPIPLAH